MASKKASLPEDFPLEVGKPAPDFSLANDLGGDLSLGDLAGSWAVLFFYPKDNTPGCTKEACGFEASLAELTDLGAKVVGISRDSSKVHQGFRAKQGLTYPLLTDKETTIHQAYGAWGLKKMYGKESIGVIRTTVLVDPDSNVAAIWFKVRVAGHVEAVVEKIRELSA